MSYSAYANSGHNSIYTDDDSLYDPDVYGNWMDGSNINMNIVAPNVRVNDINSQAQAQLQAQNTGGAACEQVCEKPKKKYAYKICKYEVDPCKKKIEYCSDSEDEEEYCYKKKTKKSCYKPNLIQPRYNHGYKKHGHHHGGNYGGCKKGNCGGYGGNHGHHHGGHGGCNTGKCGKW